MIGLLVTVLTFFSTMLGGLFALRFRDRLHLILGFTAGVVMGVAFFDILPEALDLAGQANLPTLSIMAGLVFGFMLFHVMEKVVVLHARRGESDLTPDPSPNLGEERGSEDSHQFVGMLGAGGFAIHSYLDGLAIGLAFQISGQIGLVVALAVLAHDFSDGFNTITVLLLHSATRATSFRWLLIDAVTPLLGAATALFVTVPPGSLALILAGFAGTFLYIGSSDLLPEAHHGHSSVLTILLTVLGTLFAFGIVQALQ
ncbi:MAG: ZIP family metal transporter [Chloroflexi bacterium]|nr:ZIP family metal transporter [Chloroflexota bacterium]MBI3733242.1 ZIP family metal transporter [Chloroflexota bacterium]